MKNLSHLCLGHDTPDAFVTSFIDDIPVEGRTAHDILDEYYARMFASVEWNAPIDHERLKTLAWDILCWDGPDEDLKRTWPKAPKLIKPYGAKWLNRVCPADLESVNGSINRIFANPSLWDDAKP